MACEYPPSSVFRVVPSDVPNSGLRPDGKMPEIYTVGESDCVTGLSSLAQRLTQDILHAHERTFSGFPMPRFIVMAHAAEFQHPDFQISQLLEKYVERRDISRGYPLSINGYLYITDPAAYGLPKGLTEEEVLNTHLRLAVRITYIVKNTDLK